MYNTQELDRVWDALTEYMDDDIREKVHEELAPCTNEEFLKRYLELDPKFETTIDQEFRKLVQ